MQEAGAGQSTLAIRAAAHNQLTNCVVEARIEQELSAGYLKCQIHRRNQAEDLRHWTPRSGGRSPAREAQASQKKDEASRRIASWRLKLATKVARTSPKKRARFLATTN